MEEAGVHDSEKWPCHTLPLGNVRGVCSTCCLIAWGMGAVWTHALGVDTRPCASRVARSVCHRTCRLVAGGSDDFRETIDAFAASAGIVPTRGVGVKETACEWTWSGVGALVAAIPDPGGRAFVLVTK